MYLISLMIKIAYSGKFYRSVEKTKYIHVLILFLWSRINRKIAEIIADITYAVAIPVIPIMFPIINAAKRKLERYSIKLIKSSFEYSFPKNFEKYVIDIENGTSERLSIWITSIT